MNNRLEIILQIGGERFYLDTQGVDTIPLTFNIANIKDISSTNGSFSKTINIPETQHNRDVFNNISDLNSESSFNPNLRNRAYILVDSQMVIEGYFQLSGISLDYGTYKNYLSLVVFTDNNDFYTVLGDDYIEDLDLSRYDHRWNESNIKMSWTQSYKNGYYYPLIDYGYDWTINNINGVNAITASNGSTSSGVVKTNQIFPAVYNRTIWDSIFSEAGFTWTSNSLTQSTPFDELIVPINSLGMFVSDEYILDNEFRVGLTSQQVIKSTSVIGPYSYLYDTLNGDIPYIQPDNSNLSLNLFDSSRVKFNNETYPNGDPNNLWNSTLFEYTNNKPYPVSMRLFFDMDIEQLFYYSKSQPPNLQLYRSMDVNGNVVSGGVKFQTCDQTPSTTYFNVATSSGWTETATASFGKFNQFQRLKKTFYSSGQTLFPGEKVWLKYSYGFSGSGDYDVQGAYTFFSHLRYILPGCTMSKINSNSYILNEMDTKAIPEQPISLSTCLPKKIKKRDYILSLIKMFNLIVEPSKDMPNCLNIETRDYYYSAGKIKDWSKKVDLNDPIDVQILGETQNKRTTFTYKADKDYLNADYTAQTSDVYGEYRYQSENEFITGEKKIEIIFSPTPVTSINGSELIIPKIGTVNNNKFQYGTSNIRILQKKYITNISQQSNWILNNSLISSYPYSGHLDDPYLPTTDINFGQTKGLYYTQNEVTNNNLYNTYWQRMIEEISDIDSRIITCSIYLTPQDIVDFRFNDNIYINFGNGGQYYKVNKIEGYDPTKSIYCKVEFIKTKFITIPKSVTVTKPRIISTNIAISALSSGIGNKLDTNSIAVGNNNNGVGSTGIIAVGFNNDIVSKNTGVIGNNNKLTTQKSLIVGDNNTVNGNKSFVFGDNNTVNFGVDGSFVFGDNIVVSQSNTIYLGSPTVIVTNFISAGRDEILSPFSENSVINYISGSRDKVRELGSYTNISYISSGKDSIL